MAVVVFLLHSAACHWFSIVKLDNRQLPIIKKRHSLSQQSFSLIWKYASSQTLKAPLTLPSAAPPVYSNRYLSFSFSCLFVFSVCLIIQMP